MDFLGLVLLGIGLAMDAFAVTISDALAYPSESPRRLFILPVAFGIFQAAMPVLGYFLSGIAADFMESYAGIIAFVVLAIIGATMIRDGIREWGAKDAGAAGPPDARLTFPVIVIQAIATAIDAFAVGVTLRALDANLWLAVSVIGVVTFLFCCVSVALGKRLGSALGWKAEVLGGALLVLIGIRSFFM